MLLLAVLSRHFGGLENVSDYRIGGGAVEFGLGAQR